MESVYGNSYESRDPGDYSYPSSPFNPIRGESRSSYVDTSESRTASESSSAPIAPSYFGNNRPQSFQTTVTGSKYNNLDEIDRLIERLSNLPTANYNSKEGQEAVSARKKKIDELKKLVAEARQEEAEKKAVEQIQKENDELDEAIKFLKGGYRK